MADQNCCKQCFGISLWYMDMQYVVKQKIYKTSFIIFITGIADVGFQSPASIRVSTASFVDSTGGSVNQEGAEFSPDGTKMFLVDALGGVPPYRDQASEKFVLQSSRSETLFLEAIESLPP